MSKLAGERKITTGFVIQTFQDGKCVEQEFVAGDQVEWENEAGEPIKPPEHEYAPFEMIQPNMICPHCGEDCEFF